MTPNDDVFEGYEATAQQISAWEAIAAQEQPCQASAEIMIVGPLETDRMNDAVRAVLVRHEALRTELRSTRGLTVPVALICDQPSWHAELASNSSDDHVLGLAGPAYGLDAWSLEVLCRDLAAAYSGRLVQAPDPLEYADYAAWQQEILEDPASAAGYKYWQSQAMISAVGTALPYRKNPGSTPTRMAAVRIEAGDPIGTELIRLARRWGVSPRDVLYAGWNALLVRNLGDDVPIGTTFDGRGYPELTEAVGPYARHLPMSVALRPDTPFAQHVAAVSKTATEHASWQEYFSWDKALGGMKDAGTPYFPITFDYVDLSAACSGDQIELSVRDRRTPLERTELRLVATMTQGGLRLGLEYDEGRYERTDVEYLAEQVSALVADVIARPEAPVRKLSVLGSRQRRRLTDGVNETTATVDGRCLHQLVEAVAARTPERSAVRVSGAEISYGELNRRANRLAHLLRSRGVRRSALVGVCLGRDIDAVVAQLAILKAGAAYVPLDPSHPPERLRELLSDMAAAAVVTVSAHLDALDQGPAFICLDRDATQLASRPDTRPEVEVGPEDLAYVIYTSGSSGKPKGVAIDHRGVVNTLVHVNDRFAVGPLDKVLGVSALTFDLAVYDVFGVLAAGGTVVFPPEADARDPRAWPRLVQQEQITLWNSVPALFDAVVSHAQRSSPDALATLRVAMLSGDWIPVTLPDRARQLVPGLRLESMGGATEASIWSIRYPIGEVDPTWSSIPYGQPSENQRFYVLDEQLQPCPAWVTGELAIGGIGVALGYLGRAALTAEHFVADPFTGQAGARMYLTGDLGRIRPDSTIEFCGRADNQVKLRGFRVEPGEVTGRLLSHPAVRAATTVVRDDHGAGPRLVSYVVCGAETRDDELRAFLQRRLPDYLMPSAVVRLEALPLTENGKVAYPELPAPATPAPEQVDPRNAVEEDLARLWAELLDLSRPSVRLSFFEVGGHSLLLAQLATRISEDLGVDVPLQELFEAATIEKMAELVIAAQLAGLSDEEAESVLAEALGGEDDR